MQILTFDSELAVRRDNYFCALQQEVTSRGHENLSIDSASILNPCFQIKELLYQIR